MKKTFLSVLSMVAVAIITTGMVSCKTDDEPDGPQSGTVEQLNGTLSEEKTLDASVAYDLSNPLFVAEGGVLNIPAGTKITASNGFDSYILVLKGGKINVNGTAEAPVVMTSAAASPAPGDWGGLIINGDAPLTSGNATAKTEINNDYEYGGSNASDSSGKLNYLVLEYTGAKNSADVEHNGLTLNGVGDGTTIENIFVIDGSDDGIEFFGGSVNVTNLLVVNSDDDMFDFTQGYSGTLKNAYGVWEKGFSTGESDPSGIESDGNFDGKFPTDTNQSNYKVENITFDLKNDYVSDDDTRRMQNVIRVRRGAKATISNALVIGTGRAQYLVNLNDGLADATTFISLTSSLSTAADSKFAFAEGQSATDYPNVTIGGSNTGCSTSNFAWTNYDFVVGGEPPVGKIWEGSDLNGTVEEEINLDAEVVYNLSNPLFIAEGGVLNIPEGTQIEASNGFDSYILVLQGGKININGTAANPVVMTSAEASPAPGDWGGLIINGYAPLTSSNATAQTEINNDYTYGGDDESDNSGDITYLVLEYTGAKNSADVEHNGLTLNGVGNGTLIENVFVIDGSDDGIEFFGGSVNVTNLLVVNSDDDMFDFTQGYSGTLRNAYGVWEKGFSTGESDPSGIESDGNFDGKFPTDTHQSNYKVENLTFDLKIDYIAADDTRRMQNVIRVRRGATATVTNALVKGTGRAQYLVNLNDGLANTETAISLTASLSTAADSEFAFAEGQSATNFPNVTIGGSNTGCATSNFSWTGYAL